MNFYNSPVENKWMNIVAKYLSRISLFTQLFEYLFIVCFTRMRLGHTDVQIFLPQQSGAIRRAIKSIIPSRSILSIPEWLYNPLRKVSYNLLRDAGRDEPSCQCYVYSYKNFSTKNFFKERIRVLFTTSFRKANPISTSPDDLLSTETLCSSSLPFNSLSWIDSITRPMLLGNTLVFIGFYLSGESLSVTNISGD